MAITYRCTRRAPYPKGTLGHTNPKERQAYYIQCNDTYIAKHEMGEKFPEEKEIGFDVEMWSQTME